MKKYLIPLIILTIILLSIIWRFVEISLFNSISTGEAKQSPDQQFYATADIHSETYFWGGTRTWYVFQVKNKSGQSIERIETSPLQGPYFGSRSSHSVIFWEENSKSVTYKFNRAKIIINTEKN